MSSTDIATDSDHVAPIASNLQKGGRKTLEEDDEFEDFPLDTWSSEETLREALGGRLGRCRGRRRIHKGPEG